MKTRFLIIGGDDRQLYLKRKFDENFYDSFHLRRPDDISALDDIDNYSHIILPVPVSKDKLTVYSSDPLVLNLNVLRDKLQACHIVFGCGFSDEFLNCLEDKNITYYDFMKDKTFKLLNAHLTAQGALRDLLNNTDDVITGKKALIIGFGDVAKTLAVKLKAVGLEVHIAARNKDQLSIAALNGYKTIKLDMIRKSIYMFDFVFGTVPFNILLVDDVKAMGEDSVYFELASAPYTAEKAFFKSFGRKYVLSSSLPGKYLPKASANIIYDFILNNL